jgi:hypothetical protein
LTTTPDPPPAGEPQDKPGESTNRLRAWFSSLSKGVKWLVGAIVAAGAVATAIGAILALWPSPAPELGAELSDVKIDKNVTLDQYEAHNQTASAPAPSRATAQPIVVDYFAQSTTQDTSTTDGETTTGETSSGETITGETDTGETITGETDTGETITGETDTGETITGETTTGETPTTEDWIARPRLSEEGVARLREGVKLALSDPALGGPAHLQNRYWGCMLSRSDGSGLRSSERRGLRAGAR